MFNGIQNKNDEIYELNCEKNWLVKYIIDNYLFLLFTYMYDKSNHFIY